MSSSLEIHPNKSLEQYIESGFSKYWETKVSRLLIRDFSGSMTPPTLEEYCRHAFYQAALDTMHSCQQIVKEKNRLKEIADMFAPWVADPNKEERAALIEIGRTDLAI